MAKCKNGWFLKIYNTRWTTHNVGWDARVSRIVFGNGRKDKLPVTSETAYRQVTSYDGTMAVTMKLLPSWPLWSGRRRCMKHRVFIKCDKCQQWISTGKISQHTC